MFNSTHTCLTKSSALPFYIDVGDEQLTLVLNDRCLMELS